MATDWEEMRMSLRTPNTLRLQRLAAISDLMDSLHGALSGVRTCPVCKVTAHLGGGSRQVCPYCGSFYNAAAHDGALEASPSLRAATLPNIEGDRPIVGGVGHYINRFGNFIFHDHPANGRRGSMDSNFSPLVTHVDANATLAHAHRRRQQVKHSKDKKAAKNSEEQSSADAAATATSSGSSVPDIASFPPINPGTASSVRSSPLSRGPSRPPSVRSRAARSAERAVSSTSSLRGKEVLRPNYPALTINRGTFLEDVKKAHETKQYGDMKKFYFETFESYANICATFKRSPDMDGAQADDHGLKTELLYSVHDSIREMPSVVHKNFLKGVINSMLQEKPNLFSKDKVRALFVILQSPVFLTQSSYTVLAHVLRSIIELDNGDHQLLVCWFRTLEVARFRFIVSFITQFLTVRQFPPLDRSLPPLNKSRWWIPTATRVLAILYASNSSIQPPLISYTEFYNDALDHLDLIQEYRSWQMPEKYDTFSYCQYPFMLSIVAKRHILTKDAEQQMILTARRSLVAKVSRHQAPQIDIFFLNINVRRSHLVEDSLNEITAKKADLKKKLKVTFEGEPGLDMGGLTKEWFILLIKQIFKPENKMFVYHPSKRLYWFSLGQLGNQRHYNLIGVLMGIAVYNSIILDIHFPSICYKKLLSPPVVPTMQALPVGIASNPTLEDFREIMPEVSHGLSELLKYEGDVEEDMCLTFQVSLEEYGEPRTFNLKESGDKIPVTNENRHEFVSLYLDWILNTAVYEQFQAFYLGFHTVCASNALIMLRPEEVEMLVCGSPTIDLEELRKVTEYDGYSRDSQTIKWFWEILGDMSVAQQKQLLLFTTGSDRIPVGGMGEMAFKISCWKGYTHMLPQAHTCFNQLVLPPYPSKKMLYDKLMIAISNSEGFGLE
ncbi:probable E3 ubiquitin-protein ligase HECTD2 [Hyalella azteca]|uniref:HECT-type E3 ubiquitin transferase n=1 Tax=Hyalella azteca TaxID=294128 RepID=A0A8B7N2M1_HYAAZ|nr:probable E3 ubiquitin-protein ligase HECTD2 [Hyalella azteca]